MEGVSSNATLSASAPEVELPTTLRDILRDHGLDDESTPPSPEAWSGLIRALFSPEDGPSLVEALSLIHI